ncbi:phage protease [Streptomyces sp. NPDC056401]|uniref:phage protease n=1 Tax=Streptomyces sp. NPDC056401 TaxID=3345809 RepID=UPI0035D699CA
MARGLVTKGIQIKADTKGNLPSEIELLHTGTWNAPWHGEWETTPGDLLDYVRNFEAGIGLVEADKRAHINFDHMAGKAAGWITSLRTSEDGFRLIGSVEWTDSGREALIKGEYCYISPEFNPRAYPWEDPEEEYHFVPNVLTAAAVTNAPLHKKLKPVMASAVKPKPVKADSNKDKGDPMNLADILAKKLEERTDEEKAFVEEHKEEMTDEQRTAFDAETKDDPAKGDEEELDENGNPVKASQKGIVTISAAELAKLKASAKAGEEANARLDRKEVEEFVSTHIAAGRIKSGEKKSTVDMLLSLKADARKNTQAFIEALPANERISGSEKGDHGADSATGTAQAELHHATVAVIKAAAEKGENVPYSQAQKKALAANADLANRVKKEGEA